MNRRLQIVTAVVAVGLFGLGLVATDIVPLPGETNRAVVEVVGPEGEQKATVDAEVADTLYQHYRGLSGHDHLDSGEGMLFVHDEVGQQRYVMREMDFGVDMIFADEEGVITVIHEAPAPGPDEDGGEQRYEGRAKWVLEVPYGYADERGIEVGDRLVIENGAG